jgi:CheY-like chemotaxis protein
VSALSLCDDSLPTESDLSGISGVKVLLAEDNLINQLVAKKMLAALGVKVTVVSNGRDAVDAVLGKGAMGFDVILMDMAMPVLDGVAAAVELRRLGFTLPIVAMTANLSERDQELCRDAGMNGFLSKPILKGRLGRSLKQVLTWGTLFADGPQPEKAAWQGAVQEGGAEGSGVGLRPEF